MARRIEPESHVPVYLQIVQQLRSAIAAGVYRPGEALPSMRVLASTLKVNPNTVQRAYEELDRQGLVQSHRGVGIFVARRGAQSARSRAEESLQAGLEQTVGAAFAAGLGADRISEIFAAVIDRQSSRSGART